MTTPSHSAGHVSRAKDPEIVRGSQSIFRTIRKIFLFAILAIVSLMMFRCSKASTLEKAAKAAAAARTQAARQPMIMKVGKEKQLYRFSDYPNHCVSVYLRSDAEFYPKGGRITIQPPSGELWTDEPGTSHDRGNQSSGQYVVCKASPNAWGVEIWN